MIKLTVYKQAEKKVYDITEATNSITWSGDINSCCRTLQFTTHVMMDIPLSCCIILYEDNKEIFRGFVYSREKESTSTLVNYVAFDSVQRLKDIKIAYNIKNLNAKQITTKFLDEYGLEKGSIANATVKVSKVFMCSAYDMIMTAYTEESKASGKKYMLISDKTTLGVIEKGNVQLRVAFKEGYNVVNSSFSESTENMINRVLIVDENGNFKAEVKDSDLMKVHGLFQDIHKQEEGKDNTAIAKSMLKGVEKTMSLSGYGDTTCVTGYKVQIKDSTTGLIGTFYIDSDTHTWMNNKANGNLDYTIDLQLNLENIMDEKSEGEDENKEENSSSNNGVSVSGGKEYNCEYTAYYPANDSLQGGFLDAMGNKLDYRQLTCAAPKGVPFKTKIQVKDTGTDRDNVVYTVTDRGGAIVVKPDGSYRIDLLMKDKKTAYAFGRRKGKVVIGVETTSNSGSSGGNGIGDKLVAEAKKHLGKKYVWGATGPNTFDCSGLTMYCHNKLGIKIPRVSLDQSRSGKLISKSNLQPGDLIFWKTTSAPVGHVGMYIGNNQFIHAPNSKSVVKIDSLSSSYYSSKYVNSRRYY